MKYKIFTAIIAFKLSACGAEEASNVNSVIDNVQESGQEEPSDDRDQIDVDTSIKAPKGRTVTTTTTVYGEASTTEDLGGLPARGVLSLRISGLDYECSNWEVGTLPSEILEMEATISGDRLSFQQTVNQTSQLISQSAASQTVVSSTPIAGYIDPNGSFIATGSSMVDDVTLGILRTSYHFEGVLTEAGWSGQHTRTVFAQDLYLTCEYKGTFTGLWK